MRSLFILVYSLAIVAVCSPAIGQQSGPLPAAGDTTGIAVALDTTSVARDSTLIEDSHPQDSPEDRGFLIISNDRKAQLRIRGSIRVSGVNDINGLQNRDTFSTFDIPTGALNKAEPRFSLQANQTRFGIEALRETDIGDVFMRVEGDFLDRPNRFRLRHAYGITRFMTLGQTWSTFGDLASIPNTVDLDGPNSSVALRTTLLRVHPKDVGSLRWAIAAESPTLEVTRPDTLTFTEIEPAFQGFPDIVARIRTLEKWGHVQVAGIFRSIAVRDTASQVQFLTGFGGLLSGKIQVKANTQVLFQLVAGTGISRFITALNGQGLDLIFDPGSQRFVTLTTMGGYISIGRDWTPTLSSNFTPGVTKVFTRSFQPDTAFDFSGYVSANLFWQVAEGTRLGAEYSFGSRFNRNDDSGTANRISLIAYYDF